MVASAQQSAVPEIVRRVHRSRKVAHMPSSPRVSSSISAAAIVLLATLAVLIAPVCSLAQSSPRQTSETVPPLNYTTPRVILVVRQCEDYQGECLKACPSQRLGNIMAKNRKCIQECKRLYHC